MKCYKFISLRPKVRTFLFLFVIITPLLKGNDQSWNFGPDYERMDSLEGIKLDIRYATSNNFTGKNLYNNFRSCYLHKEASLKLKKAVALLKKEKPGYRLLVFDCLRPRRIQKILFEEVKGTSQQQYVANPIGGSIHNFGFAVDLSLEDKNRNEVDMGTSFDNFTDLARPDMEEVFLKNGQLSQNQINNRRLLRKVMTEAGFNQLPIEWWHYDALPGKIVRKNYSIIE